MEDDIKIHTVGINYTHSNGLVINRPNGSGDNLLIIFKSPAFIVLNGKQQEVVSNSAILFSKGFHQLYGMENKVYINHCIHMDCDENSDIYRRAKLQFDTVFPLQQPEKTEEFMLAISRGFYSGNEAKNDVAQLLLKVMVYHLGESCDAFLHGRKNSEKNRYENALQSIRAEIYSSPAKSITVEEMAEKLNVSVSHFQRLYRKKFGTSSYDDVIRARINLAEYYLRTTSIGINEIAKLCGYESYEHFLRQFKQKTGHTPTMYRLG